MSDQLVNLLPDFWPASTRVSLFSVPWDAQYKDVVVWENDEKRNMWFEERREQGYTSDTFAYLKPLQPIKVPLPYSSIYKYNYLVVDNQVNPVQLEGPLRRFFYFITAIDYLTPQTTLVTLQLDVMTTFGSSVRFGTTFCEGGHVGVANNSLRTNPLNPRVLQKYASEEEGVSLGDTYQTIYREEVAIDDNAEMDVIIVSTASLTADPGSVNEPNLVTGMGRITDGVPSGCEVYVVKGDDFEDMFSKLSAKSWVAQCIVSITTYPSAMLAKNVKKGKLFGDGIQMYELQSLDKQFTVSNILGKAKQAWQGMSEVEYFDKFLAYPYTVIEVTNFTGGSLLLRPERLSANDLRLNAVGIAMPPFSRVGFMPEGYNAAENANTMTVSYKGFTDGTTYNQVINKGDFIDTALWLTNFPQFSIVNNSYLTYMASSVHSREAAYASASWSLTAAGMQAQNAWQNQRIQSDAALQNANESGWTQAQNIAASANTGMNNMWLGVGSSLIGTGSSAINSLAGGNYLGAGLGVVGGLAQTALGAQQSYNNITLAQDNANRSNLQSLTNARRSIGASNAVADANLDLAAYINAGNYENAIRGINAAVKDAELKPPTTSGQTGGEGLALKHGLLNSILVNIKVPTEVACIKMGQFFKRYGYRVNRYLNTVNQPIKWYHCMSRYSYVKLMDCNIIEAACNESFKDAIRGVFERGCTLWTTPSEVGVYNGANTVTTGKDY